MGPFFIVVAFWAADGSLNTQERHGLPTMEACEQALPRDRAEFIRHFGNATAYCLAPPDRPPGLPEPKSKEIGT